jgi:hypothetical protein
MPFFSFHSSMSTHINLLNRWSHEDRLAVYNTMISIGNAATVRHPG